MMRYMILLLLSAAGLLSASGFVCPANFPCYCMYSEGKYRVHCATSETNGSGIDLTIETSKLVRIQCLNSPNWSDFFFGASLRLSDVQILNYVGCQLPGPKYIESVVDQLGINGVQLIKLEKLRGNLTKADFDAFPQLKKLILNGNSLGNVAADLLYGLPKLAQLELRSTQIKLPATGFFSNSRKLKSLELSQNDLHDLQPGVFDGLDKIELLNMWSSNISSFHPQVFRGLSSLVSLDIKKNSLRKLPNNIFHDLTNLKIIDFSMNNFTELPADLFSQNRGLKIVKLMHNRVNITKLPDGFLSNLVDLKVVSLERIGLLSVPENLFWGSDGIVELNMNRNYLTTLPANLLRDARELHKLSLSFNDLQVLPDGVFSQQKKLATLDLSRNHLTIVKEHLFDGLEALQELNMEENDLKFIEHNALIPLGALRVAKFSHNQVNLRTDVFDIFGQLSPFHECKTLEELYLAHNNITEIFADWIIGLSQLRKLDLTYNSLKHLQTEDLQFISSKLEVDLTHNDISSIDLSRLEFIAAEQKSSRKVAINLNSNPIYCDCELYSLLRYTNGEMNSTPFEFITLQLQHLTCDGPKYMKGTRLLDLKASEFKCTHENDASSSSDPCAPDGICDCWLQPSDQALILDCAARNLTKAPTMIFVGNADHVDIDLSGNLLSVAPNLMDNGYEYVRSLNLAGNLIEHVNDSLISPNLKILNLHANKLSFIEDEVLTKIATNSSINLLTLRNNPWKCDCESVAFLNFVQKGHQFISDRENVSCALTNRTLLDLQSVDLCPYPIRLIIIVSSAAVLLGLLGLGVGLFFYYHRQIKIYLYSKNVCLWLIKQEELDKDKNWDVFISYSHQDEDFVIKELFAKLKDGLKPYKVCIHVRDWLAGDWIPAQIQRSVEESRRTVIVLSPHFIDSVWDKLEFQAAYKKVLNDKCTRLIMVLYGDIDPVRIEDPNLRDYLKMNTYIKWEDPWFYQKLRYALPHKCKLPIQKNKSDKLDNWPIDSQNDIEQGKVC